MSTTESRHPAETHAARLAAGQDCLAAALHTYLPNGFAITCCCDPAHIGVQQHHASTCTSPGKAPMHPWKHLQLAPQTPEDVTHLWQNYPIGNVGCVLGQASGVVRIDIDGAPGEALLATWSEGDVPPTWTFRSSPGGRGLLYRWPKTLPCRTSSETQEGNHQELRLMGNGSQTVLPPSRHPSGSIYTWDPGCSPKDLPLADAPPWLRDRLTFLPRPAHPPTPQDLPPDATQVQAALSAIPNDEHTGYDRWLELGMALHSTQAPWARDLWDTWSQQSPKFDAAKQDKSWQSFTADGAVRLGTLFRYAHEAGWRGTCAPHESEDAYDPDTGEILSPEIAALIESTRFPFGDPVPQCPPLPPTCRLDRPNWPNTWLDAYVAHSQYWAPRAAPAYHAAVGLWILSTIAARRIVCHMGSRDVYPTLFLALVSTSGLWTKTEAAMIGMKVLRRAGCGHLLAPDRTTPQFLLKLMAGIVPQNYGTRDTLEQDAIKQSLGFAAQRGWFYEEWGNMLKQMRRTDSPQAELNKLLIVLEGGAETFETGTIQRGLERVVRPYLALLGCATPHDLHPFMGEGDAWWHDGFWPRFAFASPPPQGIPATTPRPREYYQIPATLLVPLADWHARLGSPPVQVEEVCEANGKHTGIWDATVGTLPCQAMDLAADVYDAYEHYNDALLGMITQGACAEDLSAWYLRAHEKALRIAMLLASVAGEHCITMPYWAEAQATVETWRTGMHDLLALVGQSEPLSREVRLEERILGCLQRTGGMTKRELQQHLHQTSSETLVKTLHNMLKAERLRCVQMGKRTMYLLYTDVEDEIAEQV